MCVCDEASKQEHFTDVTVFDVCVVPVAGEPAAGQQVQERSSEAG